MSRAQGMRRNGPDGLKRIVISMDGETFEEVRFRAEMSHLSFAAQARDLIEIGLETLKADERARHPVWYIGAVPLKATGQ